MKLFLRVSIAKSGEILVKFAKFLYFLPISSQNYEGFINNLYFISSLMPDLSKSFPGWSPLLLHLPMDDHHFGWITKSFKTPLITT
jgi:hypothetical protein